MMLACGTPRCQFLSAPNFGKATSAQNRRYILRRSSAMALTLYTYDWVPEFPRGYVRDLRVRWGLEEAGLPYQVGTVPFKDRTADHVSHQPFAQVPYLTDGDISIFESGAI